MGRQLTTAAAAERQETMKVFSILPLVAASLGMNLKEPVVNEVMDMVESGLGETKEGRALFITLTLTESTWSVVSTVTTDLTTVSSCVSASVSECAAARSGLQKDVSNGPAILVSHTGEEVDVHAIKPTKAQAIFDRMDIDGVIHEHEDPISSGSLSFREVRMENMAKGCGRSDGVEGRPRIVIPSVESKVDSLTSTTYTSTSYSSTQTFAVGTDYCTTSGYTGALASMSVCA